MKAIDRGFKLWILLPVIFILIFILSPLAFILFDSFHGDKQSVNPRSFIGFDRWIDILSDPFYRDTLIETLSNAFLTTSICAIIGYIPAYYIAISRSTKNIYGLFIIISPLFISYIIKTMSWADILGSKGLLNETLIALGIINDPLRILYNRSAVIIGLIHFTLPFMILNIYTALSTIDRLIIDAARSLGCTQYQAFIRVILPLSVPGLASGCLLCFVLASGAYVTPLLLGGSTDAMFANVISDIVLIQMDWPLASALSVLLLLFLAGLAMIYNALIKNTFTLFKQDDH